MKGQQDVVSIVLDLGTGQQIGSMGCSGIFHCGVGLLGQAAAQFWLCLVKSGILVLCQCCGLILFLCVNFLPGIA